MDTFEFPASPAQRRMWLVEQMNPGRPTYNVSWAVRLEGGLERPALVAALTAMVDRHEALRTTLRSAGDTLMQVVAAPGSALADPPFRDLSAATDPWAAARSHIMNSSRRGFDLARGPLIAAELLRVQPEAHVLVLVAHHVVADGWSFRILFDELAADYAAALGVGARSPEPSIQYADYSIWQDEQRSAGRQAGSERYWLDELTGAETILDLPSELHRPSVQPFEGGLLHLTLDPEQTDAIRRRARARGTTTFAVLLAAHALLLSRLVGRTDVIVAVPVSGRLRPETERVVGPFMNTLPVRIRIRPSDTFDELVDQVGRTVSRAIAHQDAPFERIVELINPSRDAARPPLAQVMFQLEEMPAPRRAGGLSWSPELVDNRTSKLDLTLTMFDGPRIDGTDLLTGRLVWATGVLDDESARDFVEGYRFLLAAAVRDHERPVHEHDGLSPDQRVAVTGGWALGDPSADDVDIMDKLERTCTGPELAAAGADGRLSRDALLERAARLAGALAAHRVATDHRVGLCLRRGTGMLTAVLGVWWAGASYVPLDPAYPSERLRAMITDADLRVVLTDRATRRDVADILASLGGQGDPPVIEVLTVEDAAAATPARRRPVPPDAAAYTIFTSGSTGRPKGVTVPRGAVSALIGAFARLLPVGPADRLVALTTLSFDISVLELLLPLATGGQVVVADEATTTDAEALRRLLVQSAASVLQATPATWRMLLAAGDIPSTVRLRLCGGEALPRDLADRLGAGGAELWNVYGPTETTVWSAAGVVPTSPASIEIGPPIAGTRWYVLDDELRPVPPGAVGQIHIAGAGVARGYLGRPGMTADRFRPDPFTGDGGRLYATGDLGRWRRSGRIELLGRSDHQVKIRGFRIEPEDIESVLRRHAGVADVVVAARTGPGGDPADQRLVGYLVPVGPMPSNAELRAHLKRSLPEYLIPTTFAELKALPLTPNGKVDRRALPDPQWGHEVGRTQAPSSPTETRLARLWSEVLGLHTPVGVEDNFFALGGHSLTATQLVDRVHTDLGVRLPLRDLFAHPTIAEQAVLVERQHRPRPIPDRPSEPDRSAQGASDRRDDLLAQLAALDDDELGELLHAFTTDDRR